MGSCWDGHDHIGAPATAWNTNCGLSLRTPGKGRPRPNWEECHNLWMAQIGKISVAFRRSLFLVASTQPDANIHPLNICSVSWAYCLISITTPGSGLITCPLGHWCNLPDPGTYSQPICKVASTWLFVGGELWLKSPPSETAAGVPLLSKQSSTQCPPYTVYNLALPPHSPPPALNILLLLKRLLSLLCLRSLLNSFSREAIHHLLKSPSPLQSLPSLSLLGLLKGMYLEHFQDNDQFLSCVMTTYVSLTYFSY